MVVLDATQNVSGPNTFTPSINVSRFGLIARVYICSLKQQNATVPLDTDKTSSLTDFVVFTGTLACTLVRMQTGDFIIPFLAVHGTIQEHRSQDGLAKRLDGGDRPSHRPNRHVVLFVPESASFISVILDIVGVLCCNVVTLYAVGEWYLNRVAVAEGKVKSIVFKEELFSLEDRVVKEMSPH